MRVGAEDNCPEPVPSLRMQSFQQGSRIFGQQIPLTKEGFDKSSINELETGSLHFSSNRPGFKN